MRRFRAQAMAQARGIHPDAERIRSGLGGPMPREANGKLASTARVLQQVDVWTEVVDQLSDASLHALIIAARIHFREKRNLVMNTTWRLVHEFMSEMAEEKADGNCPSDGEHVTVPA